MRRHLVLLGPRTTPTAAHLQLRDWGNTMEVTHRVGAASAFGMSCNSLRCNVARPLLAASSARPRSLPSAKSSKTWRTFRSQIPIRHSCCASCVEGGNTNTNNSSSATPCGSVSAWRPQKRVTCQSRAAALEAKQQAERVATDAVCLVEQQRCAAVVEEVLRPESQTYSAQYLRGSSVVRDVVISSEWRGSACGCSQDNVVTRHPFSNRQYVEVFKKSVVCIVHAEVRSVHATSQTLGIVRRARGCIFTTRSELWTQRECRNGLLHALYRMVAVLFFSMLALRLLKNFVISSNWCSFQ